MLLVVLQCPLWRHQRLVVTSQCVRQKEMVRIQVDSGMVVVIFICMMYIVLVFGLLFYVKNDWCDLLFKNMTV